MKRPNKYFSILLAALLSALAAATGMEIIPVNVYDSKPHIKQL